jgi:hypothetical protein
LIVLDCRGHNLGHNGVGVNPSPREV